MRTANRRRLLASLLLTLLVTSACSSGSESLSGGDTDSLDSGGVGEAESDVATGRGAAGRTGQEAAAATAHVQERIISTGSVSLSGEDVEQLRFDVQRIADAQGGQVTEERTETDGEAEVSRSRMVLRVPTESFAETMKALEDAGDLVSSQRGSENVTQEYVDVQARVRAQERSLRRVETLFNRAERIADIVALESELTSDRQTWTR